MARVVLFIMLCPIFILLNEAFAEQTLLSTYCVDRKGNYTNNSTYEANLNHLLSILPSERGNGYGFYNLSYGSSPNQVYAIGLCRGDARPQACRDCLNNTAVLIPKRCPNRKEALEWYENCMLRYSNRSMLGFLETSETVLIFNDNNVSSNVEEFTSNLTSLLGDLRNQAASGGPLRKYATGNTSAPDFKTIYALVQCTPDLSQRDCNNCLDQMFQFIPELNGMKIGVRYWTLL